jgi:hypothetical protein
MRAKQVGLGALGLVAGLGVAWWISGTATVPGAEPDARRGRAEAQEARPSPAEPGAEDGPREARESAVAPRRAAPSAVGASEVDLVRDPATPGYDALALFRAGGADPSELFALEPRREPWAGQREASMLAYPRADILALDPAAEVTVECRTNICRIRVVSETPFLMAEFGGYPFGCGGSILTGELELTDAEGRHYADLYQVFGPDRLNETAYAAARERSCPGAREKFLERIKRPFTRG